MALGAPTIGEGGGDFVPDCLRLLFNFSTVFAVNVFILISGWFGIRCSVRGGCKFAFQVSFFLMGSYVVGLFVWGNSIGIRALINAILIKQWFVQAYMLLYLLSPVLNHFAETSGKREQAGVIAAFFLFELVYDVCFETIKVNIGHGYSAISFIGLYLLARYVRRFGLPSFIEKKSWMWLVGIVVVESIVSYASCAFGVLSPMYKMCYYDNPLNIAAAMLLLLSFEKMDIKSRIVNWIAASSFAVFLFHANNAFLGSYTQYARSIFDQYSGVVYLLIIMGYMAAWFAVAVILDQIRILLWKSIVKLPILWLQRA